MSAEPTFSGSVEEATTARLTAQQHGIDAPHLSDFVTLHFPNDANVSEIADQLSQLPQVERAVPVPSALPPVELVEAPPDMLMRTPRETLPERIGELAPSGAPLSEPLVGNSDQVVTSPVTGLENQWYIFRCRANQAWGRSSGSNVVIADVDWGCRTSHQDLAPHIGQTYNAGGVRARRRRRAVAPMAGRAQQRLERLGLAGRLDRLGDGGAERPLSRKARRQKM